MMPQRSAVALHRAPRTPCGQVRALPHASPAAADYDGLALAVQIVSAVESLDLSGCAAGEAAAAADQAA